MMTAHTVGSLPCTWETGMEFPNSHFCLAQFQLLAGVERMNQQMVFSLCVSNKFSFLTGMFMKTLGRIGQESQSSGRPPSDRRGS